MGQINRVPTGLQSLLDSKNFGDNPSFLTDQAIPVIDLDKFLESSLLRTETSNAPITVIGNSAIITIPEGELWLPLNLAVSMTNNFAAGGRAAGFFRLEVPSVGGGSGLQVRELSFVPPPAAILSPASTAARYGGNYQWEQRQLYGAGTSFRFIVSDLDLNGGVSIFMSLQMLYRRFLV